MYEHLMASSPHVKSIQTKKIEDLMDVPMIAFLNSITEANYLGETDYLSEQKNKPRATPGSVEESQVSLPECHIYSDWEVFRFNYFVWCLGFFGLGLQWTHADIGPIKDFTFEWDIMKTWGRGMWALFIFILLLIGILLYVILKAYMAIGIANYYLLWVTTLFGFIIWNTKRWKGVKKLHIHHYCIGMIMQSLICY